MAKVLENSREKSTNNIYHLENCSFAKLFVARKFLKVSNKCEEEKKSRGKQSKAKQ